MRAPPASNRPMIGARFCSAMSWILVIFLAWLSDSEPPKTVKSLAKTIDRAAVDRAPAGDDAVAGHLAPCPCRNRCSGARRTCRIPRRSRGRAAVRCARARSACPWRAGRRCARWPPPSRAFAAFVEAGENVLHSAGSAYRGENRAASSMGAARPKPAPRSGERDKAAPPRLGLVLVIDPPSFRPAPLRHPAR